MLTQLKMKNFRQHRDLTLTLAKGINTFRGANESGKSTVLEAIGYCLFGARALRNGLENTCTWGESPSSLKVELTYMDGEQVYTFNRSKNGAECLLNGAVHCTGQNEVSALSATLLGADATLAPKLIFSSQNAIRGALEEGPKALSQMIEELAGFSVWDDLMASAQKNLTLGSTDMLDERLKGARHALETATQGLPPPPDTDAYLKSVGELEEKRDAAEASIQGLDEARKTALLEWADATTAYAKRVKLEDEVVVAGRVVKTCLAQVQELRPGAEGVVDTSMIMKLTQEIAEGEDHAKRLDAYKVFQALPEGPVWNGSYVSMEAAEAEVTAKVKAQVLRVHQIRNEEDTEKRNRFDSNTCSKCGQLLPNAEQIRAKNAQINQNIEQLQKQAALASSVLKALEDESAKFAAIRKHASKSHGLYRSLSGYAQFDDDYYPMKPVWKGTVPTGSPPDVASLRRQVKAIEDNVKALDRAKAQLALAEKQAVNATAMLSHAELELAACDAPDAARVTELTEAKEAATQAVEVARGVVVLANQELRTLTSTYQSQKNLWDMANMRITDAERVIAECQKDLEVLTFNNGLVKKLRAIRPVIATRLWNTVLASVSVMFSAMRQDESWITKEKDGFRVNGQAVESLSGSALDLLGLSVRCALLRTFLPQCGLLVLDEPMHGCDDARSGAMLGFLKSVDFQQTLLVSHEEVSESVADNLIQL